MENEKRLIDANALMDAFRSYMAERCDRERCVSEENCNTCAGSCLWRKIVSAAPTVDAAEVVRCKDCKHRRNDEDYASGHYCVKRPSNGGYFCEDNDFCSYGERREGE